MKGKERMTLSIEDAAKAMSMKSASIADIYDVADGTLVVTSEGAQTLIDADGKCQPVFPRRSPIQVLARGSVDRHEPEPGPDLTPLDPAVVVPAPAGSDPEPPADPEPAPAKVQPATPAKKTAPKKA